MAYLMTDAAAGSNAAMTMMQNMGAAPLAADVGKAQAEQTIANAEKTKLANLIEQSGFQADQESKAKLQSLVSTPKFQQADSADKLRMMASTTMEAGKVEQGVKLLEASELASTREINARQKALDVQAQEFGKADAIFQAMPVDKVTETFNNLPAQQKEAVLSQVGGQQQWDKFSNEEKKAVVHNLMLNSNKKTAAAQRVLDAEKQEIITKSKEKIANINANWHMANKAGGGSKEELSTFRAYTNKVAAEDKRFTGIESRLTKAISDAKVIYDASLLQNKEDKSALSEIKSRQADLDDLRRRQVQSHIAAATMLPDSPQRDRIMSELSKQAEVLGIKQPNSDTAKPNISTGATSNKYTEQNPAKPTSKEEYDKLPPNSYYMQDGVLKRKKG